MLVVEIFKAEDFAGQAPSNLENGFREVPPVCSMRRCTRTGVFWARGPRRAAGRLIKARFAVRFPA
jgi:hypothetical protein